MSRKQPGKRCFLLLFFIVLSLIYSLQRGSTGFITMKTIIFQGSRGGPTFSRGEVQLFPGGWSSFFLRGGVQMLISIETHITCDFRGGGGGSGPSIPTLDPHMSTKIVCVGP